MASTEFGVTTDLIGRRLKGENIIPGEDKCYSTRDIARALFGNYDRHRARKMESEAEKWELETAITRKELVKTDKVVNQFHSFCIELRQLIMGSSLPHEEKEDLLTSMAKAAQSNASP